MNAKFAATMQASQVVPSFLLSLKHSVLSVKANGLSRPCTLYTICSSQEIVLQRHKVKHFPKLTTLRKKLGKLEK